MLKKIFPSHTKYLFELLPGVQYLLKGCHPQFNKTIYTVESIDGQKIYVKNEEGTVLGKFFKPYQLVNVDSVEKHEKPNESHEDEHNDIQRERKHQRVLKAVGINQGNIVEGKRERKTKEVFDL